MSSVLQKATTFYFACLAGVASAGLRNSAFQMSEFSAWCAQHNKSYENAADANKHMHNFMKNKAIIQAKNQKHTKARFAIDSLADLSKDEFIKQKTGARLDHPLYILKNNNDGGNRRLQSVNEMDITEVDWTHKMSPVRDQQTCGVCWATSAASVQEAVHAIQYELEEPVLISEQEMVDCASLPDAPDCYWGGYPEDAWDWASEHGSQRYEDYPYENTMNVRCQKQQDKWVVSQPTSWEACWGDCSTRRLVEALQHGPVVTTVNAYCLYGYSSGVLSTADYGNLDENCTPDALINHAVVLVGVKEVEGTLSWIIQNSWGAEWGDQGFVYIAVEEGAGLGNVNMAYMVLNEVEDRHLVKQTVSDMVDYIKENSESDPFDIFSNLP